MCISFPHIISLFTEKKAKETSVQLQHAEEKTQKFISTDQETVMQHEMSATTLLLQTLSLTQGKRTDGQSSLVVCYLPNDRAQHIYMANCIVHLRNFMLSQHTLTTRLSTFLTD